MQSRLLLLLLRPSLLSLLAVLFVALGILLWNNWPYFTYNDALYKTLYGEFGAITALEQSPLLVQGTIEGLSTDPVLYMLAVILAACSAGWIVFILVRALRLSGETGMFWQHAATRTVVLIFWVLYSATTIHFIVPFCLLFSRIGAEAITTPDGILMNVGAFTILAVTLHLHVIFLRLFLLRPRVFGGTIATEEATFPVHVQSR